MSWILRLIPLPFMLFLAGLASLGVTGALFHFEHQKSIARENGVPATIAAGDLPDDIKPFPFFEEVSVRLQLHDDLTYVYWDETIDGYIEYPVLFFFDPETSDPNGTVLGAIAFNSFEEEAMQAYMETTFLGEGPSGGSIFEMAGIPAFLRDVTSEEVRWAAEDLGLTMADNFLYLNPHFEGREQIIAARPELQYVAAGAGMLLIWLSMIAAIVRRRWRRAAESTVGHVAKKGLVAAAAGGVGALISGAEDSDLI